MKSSTLQRTFYSKFHEKLPLKTFFLSLLALFLFAPGMLQAQISSAEQAKIDFLLERQGNSKTDPNARTIAEVGLELISSQQHELKAPKQAKKVVENKEPQSQVSDEKCGFEQAEAMIREQYPNRKTTEEFEDWMKNAKKIAATRTESRDVVTIPVVVHIVGGGPVAISDAQVQTQIDVLNEDFRRMNADAANTPADFVGVAADSEIEFCLATVDPDGAPSNGINRFDGGQTSYSIADMQTFIKPTSIWHPDFYFNIWVAPLQGGLLGYAQFPSASGLDGLDPDEGPSFTDGIVTRDFAFGVGGSASAPFDKGRTTTHEAGHFFGLRHIGGDGGCGADDFCADTPTQDGQNNNMEDDCSYPATNSCDDGEGDLPDQFMNYMDYSDDACMNLFTLDQKARMDAVLMLSPRRASLLNSQVCNGVAPDYPYDPFADAPENDLCSGAIPVECDDVITGSTASASPLEQPQACSPEPEAPGVWYSIVGDGNPLTASLCAGTDYDTKIGIYSGTCGDLVCEGGDDDGCGGIGVPSSVTINTVDGETYYIFVTGWNGSTGNFTLTISCDDEPPVEGPENDFCEGAITVSCGESVDGTTIGAVQDLSGTCGTTISAPGVWYNFVGTGEFITASLCDQATFDTKINIIEALDCDSDLFCVGGNDDGFGCGGFTSEVTFFGAAGVNYYIYVNGFGGATGDFTLSIDCNPPVENDLCENAISIGCGDAVEGSTLLATNFDQVGDEDCSEDPFSDIFAPGVWYSIEGTGGLVTLSTCGTADYDTKIDVYTGQCGDLTCYAGNEDADGCPLFTSELTMPTEQGETYYVYVSGYADPFFGASQGNFLLTVDCACAADAGECATVYNGYDPASCTDLTATVEYGVGPYTYEWSNGMTGETITVCPEESTTYTVTITDSEGCVDTDDVYVDVIDVTCGRRIIKVNVCKITPSGVERTLCISSSAVPAMLCQGNSYLGECGTIVICGEPYSCEDGDSQSNEAVSTRSLTDEPWDLSPNPTSGRLNINLNEFFGQTIDLRIVDAAGKLIVNEKIIQLDSPEINMNVDDIQAGVYYFQVKTESDVSTKKFLVIK